MKSTISVLIATKDRPEALLQCLSSVLKSTVLPLEIIIIDQSISKKVSFVIPKFNSSLIRYFHQNKTGKSVALNFGIEQARGDILAFTDDDCIVDENWLQSIKNSFSLSTKISICTGKTLPYHSKENIGKYCPCTFQREPDLPKLISKPGRHWVEIGYGNNFAIKRHVIKKNGCFKEWLGPGSIGKNAEDAELFLRLFLRGYIILHNPRIISYHNKWNTLKEIRESDLIYSCGGTAAYGLFALSGHSFAKKIVLEEIRHVLREFRILLNLIPKQKYSNREFFYLVRKTFYIAWGFVVALFYFYTNSKKK